MKIIKLIFGVLFGLYAAAQGVQLLVFIFTGRTISEILGCLCGLCIGAAVSIVLFGSAMKTKLDQKGYGNKGVYIKICEKSFIR